MTTELATLKTAVTDRALCWFTYYAFMFTVGGDWKADVPPNQLALVASATLELLSIILLLRVNAGEVGRDIIDLSLYSLFWRIGLLGAYFFAPGAYAVLYDAPSVLFQNMVVWVLFARLVWGNFRGGRYQLAEWPPIGIYGWVWQRSHPCSVSGLAAYPAVLAALVIAIELGAICMAEDPVIYRRIGGGIGIALLWFYARPIRQEVVDTERDALDQEARIDRLEDIIETGERKLGSDFFAHLVQGQAEPPPATDKPAGTVTHLRVVPREPDSPRDGDEPDTSG